ncbi:hypothetical protein FKP32DRAFT_1590295 [Trametes sanguinea]|nr:hypothetical protein FKP32DRAFT_1590295 [Trametes sanguinea]
MFDSRTIWRKSRLFCASSLRISALTSSGHSPELAQAVGFDGTKCPPKEAHILQACRRVQRHTCLCVDEDMPRSEYRRSVWVEK